MTIRAGMDYLVDSLRSLTSVSVADYSDNDLQNILDRNKYFYQNIALTVTPNYTTGNILVYRRIYLPENLGQWFETPVNNVVNAYFSLMDYQHAPIFFGTGDEKAVYDDNFKTITLNTGSTHKVYYLDIYSYDMYGAAAYIWKIKVTDRVAYIDIKTDNHTLSLDQEYKHCVEQYLWFYTRSLKAKNKKLVRRDQGAGISLTPSYYSSYQPVTHNDY